MRETPGRWGQQQLGTGPLASGFHTENMESCRLTASCTIHAEKEKRWEDGKGWGDVYLRRKSQRELSREEAELLSDSLRFGRGLP